MITIGKRILAALRKVADEDGIVPVMRREEMAALCGVTPGVLNPQLWELARFGALEKLDRRAPDKCTSRYRITGKPAARDGSGEVIRSYAVRERVDDDVIARSLRKKHGIEVETKTIADRGVSGDKGVRDVAMSLPKLRFLDGAAR